MHDYHWVVRSMVSTYTATGVASHSQLPLPAYPYVACKSARYSPRECGRVALMNLIPLEELSTGPYIGDR